jgi:hypothetical protein
VNPTELKRQVLERGWAKGGPGGYFPAPTEVRWPALDTIRGEHEAAVAELEAAKGSAIAPAIERLCELVDQGVGRLRLEGGLNLSGGPETTALERATARAREAYIEFSDRLGQVENGTAIQDLSPDLQEPCRLHRAVREDEKTILNFLRGLEQNLRLLHTSIVPASQAEARAFRDELGKIAAAA